MLVQFLVVACAIVVLLCGLFIYARFSKSDKPMMRGGCHGDCTHCASHCEDDEKKR